MTVPLLIEQCREFRKHPTKAEALLWKQLRNKQLAGLKFRRQHPLEGFVVDFYCFELRLAIELDGGVHQVPEQVDQDEYRMRALQNEGVTFLRFWNSEVVNNMEKVMSRIHSTAQVLQFKITSN